MSPSTRPKPTPVVYVTIPVFVPTSSGGNQTNLRRVDAEILERIEGDEDIADIRVHLQLLVPLLEMTDNCLLGRQEEKHITSGAQ